MNNPRVREIRKAQKESFLFEHISRAFLQLTQDEPRLQGLYVNRVRLSPEGGMCKVYFLADKGLPEFEEKRPILVLYKPSMRTSLAKALQTRYAPDLRFVYDEQGEKQIKMDQLFDRLKEEDKL